MSLIKLRAIYRVFPVLLVKWGWVTGRHDALCVGPVVFLKPGHWETEPLIQHELTHSRQMVRTLGIHALLYWLRKAYRLKAEAEAYAVQWKAAGSKQILLGSYAALLTNNYGLSITQEEAVDAIRGQLGRLPRG